MAFLPVTLEELGGRQADFILVTGDAYVDHPSFGASLIGRLLESHGFTVAILPQPVVLFISAEFPFAMLPLPVVL